MKKIYKLYMYPTYPWTLYSINFKSKSWLRLVTFYSKSKIYCKTKLFVSRWTVYLTNNSWVDLQMLTISIWYLKLSIMSENWTFLEPLYFKQMYPYRIYQSNEKNIDTWIDMKAIAFLILQQFQSPDLYYFIFQKFDTTSQQINFEPQSSAYTFKCAICIILLVKSSNLQNNGIRR